MLRLHSPALLACLLICSTFLSIITHPALGQSTQILVAKQDLLQAFQSIQKAEQQGASNTDLLPLSIQLNTALKYEESAEILSEQGNASGAYSYAVQSINLSTQVAVAAEALGNEAQNSSSYRTILAYTIAIVAAVFSTIVVLEANRIWRIVGRRRLLKAKINYRKKVR
ncbi:MAG TPA: hypothetical protein VF910_05720 [Candidatus Bathyarchaeia archaeon]|nr:hypothetical protein [Candidatus Limnocylindrales bacterium]